MPIVTHHMKMTVQIQITDVDQCRDTTSPLQMDAPTGILKPRC